MESDLSQPSGRPVPGTNTLPACGGGQGGGATGGGRLTASSRSEEVGSTGGDQSPLSCNWLLVNSAAMLGLAPAPGARTGGAAATVAGAAGAPEVKAFMMFAIVCWIRGSASVLLNESRPRFQTVVPAAKTQAPLGAW